MVFTRFYSENYAAGLISYLNDLKFKNIPLNFVKFNSLQLNLTKFIISIVNEIWDSRSIKNQAACKAIWKHFE